MRKNILSTILFTLVPVLAFANTAIVCDNIENDGTGSVYAVHTYSLSAENLPEIDNYNWTFKLKDTSGNYVEIETSSQPKFTTKPVDNTDNYAHTATGDLSGLVECRYTINGEPQSAPSLNISLSAEPYISAITDINRVWDEKDPDYFYLTFNVHYYGANRLDIFVEEEFSSVRRLIGVNESLLAHVKTGLINSLYYAWVDILVQNKYGSAQETIELEPYNSSGISNSTVSENVYDDNTIYDINGSFIKKAANPYLLKDLKKGLYIVQTNKDGKPVKREKLLIK